MVMSIAWTNRDMGRVMRSFLLLVLYVGAFISVRSLGLTFQQGKKPEPDFLSFQPPPPTRKLASAAPTAVSINVTTPPLLKKKKKKLSQGDSVSHVLDVLISRTIATQSNSSSAGMSAMRLQQTLHDAELKKERMGNGTVVWKNVTDDVSVGNDNSTRKQQKLQRAEYQGNETAYLSADKVAANVTEFTKEVLRAENETKRMAATEVAKVESMREKRSREAGVNGTRTQAKVAKAKNLTAPKAKTSKTRTENGLKGETEVMAAKAGAKNSTRVMSIMAGEE